MRADRLWRPLLLAALAISSGCGEPSPYGTLPGVGQPVIAFSQLPAELDVDAVPSKEWTDLALKVVPTINGGGDAISAADRESSAFRFTILADIEKPRVGGAGHAFRKIGVGLTLPINGHETVVT